MARIVVAPAVAPAEVVVRRKFPDGIRAFDDGLESTINYIFIRCHFGPLLFALVFAPCPLLSDGRSFAA